MLISTKLLPYEVLDWVDRASKPFNWEVDTWTLGK
jgi:hypothetical protein